MQFFQAIAQQVEVARYDVVDGLPQSMVNHVVQDTDGFIWLGTGDGLARFDGSRFVVYKHDPDDSTSLSHNSIWGIAQVDQDHLYIGTRSGMDLLDTHTGVFMHLRTGSTGGKDGCWRPVHVRKDRALFYSPLTAETLVRSPDGWSRRATKHQPAYCLRTSGEGRYLHAILFPDTLVTIDTRTGTEGLRVIPNAAKDRVLDMIRLERGWLLMGEHTIWQWMDDGTVKDVPADLQVLIPKGPGAKSAARDAVGDLWLGISGVGVVVLRSDLSVRQIYRLLPENEGPLRITTITFDHQGNTWVGTDGKGVFRIAPQRIKFGRAMPGTVIGWQPVSWFVRGFAQWDEHRVVVSFQQGGLALFDERSGSLSALPMASFRTDGTYEQVLRDADGIIWMIDDITLMAVDPRAQRILMQEDEPLGSRLLLDLANRLLVITPRGMKKYRFQSGRLMREEVRRPVLETWLDSVRNAPEAAAMDPLGRVWTSSAVTAIDVWTAQDVDEHMRPLPFDVQLNHLFDNGDGTGWVNTNNGIYGIRWEDLHITRHILPTHGLPDRFIYGVISDGAAQRWLSSNRGLTRTTMAMDSMHNYTVADGLQSMEFNSRAFFRSVSGRLYFGGINGFDHFVPDKVLDDPDRPNVVIVRAWAQDSLLARSDPDAGLELPYPDNRLELEIAVLEMSAPEQAMFRYRMVGFQDEWRTAPPGRPLVLERIPDGSFTLEVQGLNADGVAGPVSRLLSVSVVLPFWSTMGSRFLLGGLLAAGIGLVLFSIYRSRKNTAMELVEREMKDLRMRTRLAKDIHDDVGSGLARMSALSGSPKRNTDSDERFDKVNDISGELLANLRDVVWMNDPRHGTLDALLIRLRTYANDVFEETGAVVTCHFPEPLPTRIIHGSSVRNLFLIAKEALHNARKYSGARNIELSWHNDLDEFTMEVIDDGSGVTTVVPQGGGRGTVNMRQRAEEMNATFHRNTTPGSGTTVRIQGRTSCLDG